MRGDRALASDKDAHGFLTVLIPIRRSCGFTEASGSGGAHPAKELEALAKSMGMDCESEPDPQKAWDRAAAKTLESGGWIL